MTTHSPATSTAEVIATLAEQVRQIEVARRPAGQTISSGLAAFDRWLPQRGFQPGTIVEWLAAARGSGAGTLALLAAREALSQGGAVVVVDRPRRFHASAAARLGLDLERLIVVRPTNDEDQAWALDQALRSRGVAAVCCWSASHDDHAQRRWQLAAEASGALGLLLRTAAARQAPSWAELRLWVEPLAAAGDCAKGTVPVCSAKLGQSPASRNRRLRVELLRNRGGRAGGAIELELRTPDSLPSFENTHHETHPLPVVPALAARTIGRRSRGA